MEMLEHTARLYLRNTAGRENSSRTKPSITCSLLISYHMYGRSIRAIFHPFIPLLLQEHPKSLKI